MSKLAPWGSFIGAVLAGLIAVLGVTYVQGQQAGVIAEVSRTVTTMAADLKDQGEAIAYIKGRLEGAPGRVGSLN